MKKRVLILDDDDNLQELFRIIFEREGYEVEVEPNGDKILKGDYELPDIFLFDKNLSGADGDSICSYLKKSPDTCDIPVILMSASPDIHTMYKLSGADGFIEKPFTINDLLNIIDSHIHKQA